MKKDFNIIIAGTGGQGLITILQIIAEAALDEGYDVKTSELHGLSQRGGSVEVHIRFGKKIYSPIVSIGSADLILGLEMQEAIKASYFANSKTIFLVNKYFIPISIEKLLTKEEIVKNLKKVSKNIFLIPAADICQEKFGTDVVAGVYLISLACFKGLVPIKPASIKKAIKKITPKKYLGLNLKAFNLSAEFS